MDKLPGWLEDAARGLAFWVGYSDVRYGEHLLSEGAVVAEFVRLVDARLGQTKHVRAEVPYRQLEHRYGRKTRERADLVVLEGPTPTPSAMASATVAVIEIKRLVLGRSLLEKDLERLFKCLEALSGHARAFVVLIAQGRRPRRFVHENGTAQRQMLETKSGVRFKVRRVFQARLGPRAEGHYTCILEVDRKPAGKHRRG
jgi:hypothetical protein